MVLKWQEVCNHIDRQVKLKQAALLLCLCTGLMFTYRLMFAYRPDVYIQACLRIG